jgi:hypothetical protein
VIEARREEGAASRLSSRTASRSTTAVRLSRSPASVRAGPLLPDPGDELRRVVVGGATHAPTGVDQRNEPNMRIRKLPDELHATQLSRLKATPQGTRTPNATEKRAIP